ncbi:hypothetical protein POTOM_053385 [Populus tomentosa]|uniref:Uncharacterized protein n=1 Tax=Populus tomentosa TaxID=118781 RepID=A0A8X7XY12_POPTO|nr:hypothetical protein POTOM_053385 [Populus tomentosa]
MFYLEHHRSWANRIVNSIPKIVNLSIVWPTTIANVLYKMYKNQGFEILAFPCNQFAGQEPGGNEEIQDTIDVNGKNTAPVYKF